MSLGDTTTNARPRCNIFQCCVGQAARESSFSKLLLTIESSGEAHRPGPPGEEEPDDLSNDTTSHITLTAPRYASLSLSLPSLFPFFSAFTNHPHFLLIRLLLRFLLPCSHRAIPREYEIARSVNALCCHE